MLQYFGTDLGYEVVAIDSIASQSGSDLYLFWDFSVNGTASQKGIDQTFPSDGDCLGWNYVSYQPDVHLSKRVEAIRQRM